VLTLIQLGGGDSQTIGIKRGALGRIVERPKKPKIGRDQLLEREGEKAIAVAQDKKLFQLGRATITCFMSPLVSLNPQTPKEITN
jgi:hypothetical protein